VLLLAVVLLEYGRGLVNSRDTLYSRSSLESDVAAKRVRYVAIMPNAETPTGSVKVSFSDGSDDVVFYSTDVAAIETYLVSNGVNVEVKDVPTENVLINGIIPIIVGLVVMVFVFSMFSGAQNANSGNSRMMNFGKSRAKMSTGEDNKITLNDVAGLKEEKEQLSEIIEFLKDPEKLPRLVQGSQRVSFLKAPQEQVRLFLQELLQEKLEYHFLVSPVQTLLRCL
jgi:cell division protease FtsH